MYHLRQLHCAVALADHRHFGRAADEVGITQSGLTQSIKRLEAHYGVPLFARHRKGVSLTAFGEVVVQAGRQVLERMAALEREVQLLNNLETGHLIVGVDPMLANALLAPALTELLHRHPRLRFSVRSGGWDELLPELTRGNVDLFLGFEGRPSSERLERLDFDLPAPLIVGAADHPLRHRQHLLLKDFLEFPVVQGPVAQWYLDWAQGRIDREDAGDLLEPYFLHANDAGLLVGIARRSHALLAAMPEDVEDALASGVLVEIPLPDWPQRIPALLVRDADRPLSPAAERMIEVVAEAVAAL